MRLHLKGMEMGNTSISHDTLTTGTTNSDLIAYLLHYCYTASQQDILPHISAYRELLDVVHIRNVRTDYSVMTGGQQSELILLTLCTVIDSAIVR